MTGKASRSIINLYIFHYEPKVIFSLWLPRGRSGSVCGCCASGTGSISGSDQMFDLQVFVRSLDAFYICISKKNKCIYINCLLLIIQALLNLRLSVCYIIYLLLFSLSIVSISMLNNMNNIVVCFFIRLRSRIYRVLR